MPGDRVDRLRLTTEPLAGADVEQHAVARDLGGAAGVDGGHGATAHHDVSRRHRRRVTGLDRVAGGLPGAETPVEHAYVVVTSPPQQPPGPRGNRRVVLVVDDDRPPGSDAEPAQGRLSVLRGRQRVAPAGAGWSGQVAVEVGEDGARQVSGAIAVQARRATEGPSGVDQVGAGDSPAAERAGQVGDGEQRGPLRPRRRAAQRSPTSATTSMTRRGGTGQAARSNGRASAAAEAALITASRDAAVIRRMWCRRQSTS